ncbi:hypothetical protein BamMEX5DRAFT_7037 [Burkholderia ambifaria MEX-5]|uniref:Uncharacterized protein n=1 Tax=Burkholderia ambifaria MEX-5 TaxID=396597 RepID=B1TGX1_9BURK|nr:hypothetical protein BamMEX5DRAFT_7037 [Burkholderia ambifaria MEX-5]
MADAAGEPKPPGGLTDVKARIAPATTIGIDR